VPNPTQANTSNTLHGDACNPPTATITPPGAGILSVRAGQGRADVALGVEVSHRASYQIEVWPSADDNCIMPIGSAFSAQVHLEPQEQRNVVFVAVANVWHGEFQRDDLHLCGTVVRTEDQAAIATAGFPIQLAFDAEDPTVTATLRPNTLHVSATFGDGRGQEGFLHEGWSCEGAPIEPRTHDGREATWRINDPQIHAGWSVHTPSGDCVDLHVFNFEHHCTAGEAVNALICALPVDADGDVTANVNGTDTCLTASAETHPLHITGVCPQDTPCADRITVGVVRLHATVQSRPLRSPRMTQPRGLPHSLPTRLRPTGAITDIALSVSPGANPQRSLHMVGGGFYQHLQQLDNAWVQDDALAWNNQAHLGLADLDHSGALNLVRSNGPIWGNYYVDDLSPASWFGLNGDVPEFANHRFTVDFSLGDLDGDTSTDVALLTHRGNPQNAANNPNIDNPPPADPVIFVALTTDTLGAFGANTPRNTSTLRAVPIDAPTGLLMTDIIPGGSPELIVTHTHVDPEVQESRVSVVTLGPGAMRVTAGPLLEQPVSEPTRIRWDDHRDLIALVVPTGVIVVDEGYAQIAHRAVPGTITSIAAGDLNGDGRDDLLVTDEEGTLSLLQRYGTGFNAAHVLDHPHRIGRVLAFNEPGQPFDGALLYRDSLGFQLVQADPTDGPLSLLPQLGGGQAITVPLGFTLSHAIDLNGDGRDELIGTDLNGQLHSYQWRDLTFTNRGPVTAHTVGDVDGDGRDNLIIAQPVDGALGSLISVLSPEAGDGPLDLQPITNVYNVGTARQLAVGDTNGDGRAEISACNDNLMKHFSYEAADGGGSLLDLGSTVVTNGCRALAITNMESGGSNETSYVKDVGVLGTATLITVTDMGDDLPPATRLGQFDAVQLLQWHGRTGRPKPLLYTEDLLRRRALTAYRLNGAEHEPSWQLNIPDTVTHVITGDLMGDQTLQIIFAHHVGGDAYLSVVRPNNDRDAFIEMDRSVAFRGTVQALVIADLDGDGTAEAVAQVENDAGIVLRALGRSVP
jgi:hypothetical protein